MISIEQWNDLYDKWYDAENRADKYQVLFYIAGFFVVIFGLTILVLV